MSVSEQLCKRGREREKERENRPTKYHGDSSVTDNSGNVNVILVSTRDVLYFSCAFAAFMEFCCCEISGLERVDYGFVVQVLCAGYTEFDYEDSDRSSVYSTPSPQTRQFQTLAPSSSVAMTTASAAAAGGYHPSLRKKRWFDRQSAVVSARQKTLEKSWSLQTDRPLSLLAPYSAESSVIANKVADTLLQQVHVVAVNLSLCRADVDSLVIVTADYLRLAIGKSLSCCRMSFTHRRLSPHYIVVLLSSSSILYTHSWNGQWCLIRPPVTVVPGGLVFIFTIWVTSTITGCPCSV